MNTKQIVEVEYRTNYAFRNALVTYNRAAGFKNPIESADKDIKEYVDFIKETAQQERNRIVVMVESMKEKEIPLGLSDRVWTDTMGHNRALQDIINNIKKK